MNPIPNRTVNIDADKAVALVEQFCERTGREMRDEFTASEAVGMLTEMGYAVRKDTLREFVAKGYISDFGESWTPVALYALTAALESRRRWLPTPSVHDVKKSGARLETERLHAEGVESPIEGIEQTSLEDLLLQLTQCDQRSVREVLLEAVRVKLETSGFIEE